MMNGIFLISIHVLALATLLAPIWFEIHAPDRPPYTFDPKVMARTRVAMFIALPLFIVCLTLDGLYLMMLPEKSFLFLAIWCALELYLSAVFITGLLKNSKDTKKIKTKLAQQNTAELRR